MPFAKANHQGEIYYESLGKGAPVLLVAGIGGASGYWKPQVKSFSENFHLVLHDHRGTGKSSKDKLKYSVELMTDDMIAVMDELDLKSAHIVGHSTGAVMAQDMAMRYQDRIRSAVMYSGWARKDSYFQRCFDVRKRVLLDSGPLAYVQTTPLFLMSQWYVSKNINEIEAGEQASADTFPPIEIMCSRIDAICAYGPEERLRDIKCQTAIICAKDDHLTPTFYSEEIAGYIPHAQTHFFETGGHAISQVLPDEFNDYVIKYLIAAENEFQKSNRDQKNG